MSDTKRYLMLLHPLVRFPHVYKDDYGTEGVTFKALFPQKITWILIHTVLLELGSRHGDEAALPLRVSPGGYR